MATGTGFSPQCYPPRMTRAEAMARRTAGTLKENCVVVITDGPTIGAAPNTSPTEIELNPTSPTELGLTARVFTTFDDSAWAGTYDIDLGVAGSITRLTDSRQNTAVDNDADSPTVHTQFPWGNLQWRDNYVEDTVFTNPHDVVAFAQVLNSKFINTTMDFTGMGPNGGIFETTVREGGTHKIFGAFSLWNRSLIDGATVSSTAGRLNLSDAVIVDTGTSVTTTGPATANLTINNSRVRDGSIITNAGDVAMTIAGSDILDASQILNDVGSLKVIGINRSVIEGGAVGIATIRGQAGTVTRNQTIFNSHIQGGTLLIRDDASIVFSQCEIDNSTITVDGASTATSALQFTLVKLFGCILTHGTAASNCQWLGSELKSCNIDVQGPGNGGFAVVVQSCTLGNTRIRTTAGATGQLTIANTTSQGSGFQGTIAMDADTPRDLYIDGGNILSGPFSIIQTGTTATADPLGDRVSNCTVQGGDILFATTVGGTFGNIVGNCLVVDGPDAPGVPDGRILIDGTSARCQVFQNEVWGDLHITDAPEGALVQGTAMYDNYIGGGSSLVYSGGDATDKQIRNNRIEGLSHLFCTGLTSGAGALLADVFSCRVANQSVMNVNGARVVGFPVRNIIVENQAILTVDPGGSILQGRVAQQANLATGAFNHFVVEVSGAFVVVLTAANFNTLKNKGFSDVV